MNLYKKILNRLCHKKPKHISKEKLKDILASEPIIVEAGAHIGKDTVEMADLWPKGTLHAFEPIPNIFDTLCNTTKKFKNVKCYPMALSDKDGQANINVSSGASDGSSSILIPKEHLAIHPNVVFNEKIEVKTITLDTWAAIENISNVDFLWLDLQGYELNVLKTATTIIDNVTAIYTEINLVENYLGGALYPELRKWLGNRGFSVETEFINWADGGNVLFLRR